METSRMQETGSAYWWVSFLTRLPRYKYLLRKRWWVLAVTVAIGLLGAAWRVASLPQLFVSTSRLMVTGKMSFHEESASYNEEASNFFGTQIEWMRSAEVRRRAEERLRGLYPAIQPVPVALEASQIPHTSIFLLTATGGAPDFTQKYLNACIDEYIDARKEVRSEKSDTLLSTLTDQLTRFEKEARDSEEELLNFQKQNNISSLQEECNSASNYLSKLNEQLADLQTEYELLKLLNIDQAIERKPTSKGGGDTSAAPAGSDSVIKSNAAETDYERARQEIEVLKAKRADLSKVLRPKHPDMIQLNQDIDRQETLIKAFRGQTLDQLKTRRESLDLQIKNLQTTLQVWEAKSLALSQKLAEYNKIKSKGDRAKASYDSILASSRSVDLGKNTDQDLVAIVERATPAFPVRPELLKTIALGLFAGLLAGAGILFILDKIDDRMNSYGEFQAHFSEEVLAKIPMAANPDAPLSMDAREGRMAFVESMRALRSSLHYLPVQGTPPRTFLITSAVPNEGKSTIAISLAITMSFAGTKVLLVDGDLRRGSIHEKFGLENGIGLGDVFKDASMLEKAVQPTKVANLFLMSRGANIEHPGENYLSSRADQLLKTLYPDFDCIIFDSSPVLVADDTTSFAPKIDATILVIRFAFSSARRSREAIELLKKRQVNLIGVICNGVNQSMQDYYYNKYPEYYAAKHEV
jgi:capsular exopolysaccharide synthesis family protein